jgi:hypothetical protein
MAEESLGRTRSMNCYFNLRAQHFVPLIYLENKVPTTFEAPRPEKRMGKRSIRTEVGIDGLFLLSGRALTKRAYHSFYVVDRIFHRSNQLDPYDRGGLHEIANSNEARLWSSLGGFDARTKSHVAMTFSILVTSPSTHRHAFMIFPVHTFALHEAGEQRDLKTM